MKSEKLVLASANPKKVAELRQILGNRLELLARPPEVPDVVEDAPTFVGNARLKAAALVRATGLAALADDSGLEVDALDGAPGVRSARYAAAGIPAAGIPAAETPAAETPDAETVDQTVDEANVRKLLTEMAGWPDPRDRRARFRCVLVLQRPDGSELVAEGQVEGHLALAPRGSAGFGYDPVFVPEAPPGVHGPDDPHVPDARTFAEMDPAEKHAISHRGRALADLLAQLG